MAENPKQDLYDSDSDSDISDSDTPPPSPKKHDAKKKSSKLKESGEKKVDENEGSGSPEQKLKKLSWFQKKSKGFASAAAGSRVGKGILKDFLDADSNRLLKALKVLITKDVSKGRAKEVERDIIKSAVKVVYLYQEKRVTEDSFNGLTFSFRRICSAIRNAYQARNLDKATAERIEGMCINFAENIILIIKPFVHEKSTDRIRAVIGYIASPAFLQRSFKYEEFAEVAYVLSSYLKATG